MKVFDLVKSKFKELTKSGALYASWYGINNPFGGDSFTTVGGAAGAVANVITFAINFSGLVAVVIIIYGAYLMIIAAGDSDKIQSGEQTITNGIIGLIVVFVAKLVIMFVIERIS